MKKSIGVVHGIADCIDCGWHAENYRNAQALAAKHAKKYSHTVEGEVGLSYTYDGHL